MSTIETTPSAGETLHCARHPNTETVLRCGRCDTPICPKCLIATPVGARCPTCAQVKRFALLVKPPELARAVAYGVGTAAVGTVILLTMRIPFFGILVWALLGFLVGEAVSIGANRKRARELSPIAVACLVLGFAIGVVVLLTWASGGFSPAFLLRPVAFLAADLFLLLGLGIGALLAWMRVR